MTSVITVYNDNETLNNMLVKSLTRQNGQYELILIDNTQNAYPSAAEALNEGVRRCIGELVVVVHQDVEFFDCQLDLLVDFCKSLEANAIIGVAGAKNSGGVYTNILHGDKRAAAGNHNVGSPMIVQTLDEVCFAASKQRFIETPFDEKTCSDWHLYCVDFCLSSIRCGSPIYVVPVLLYHKSSGKIGRPYFETMMKISKKFKDDFREIHTTCFSVKTSSLANTHILRSKYYINALKNNIEDKLRHLVSVIIQPK